MIGHTTLVNIITNRQNTNIYSKLLGLKFCIILFIFFLTNSLTIYAFLIFLYSNFVFIWSNNRITFRLAKLTHWYIKIFWNTRYRKLRQLI